ncbi:unnamed protein product [Trichogramma brassicae]|uniref:Uncharacterized protein n=1 Tax=Trichogramma brassicae TaxID=86971 RepID=A0A6H5IVN3_9HYME|nr:unnamed protein product [Trichogramma brassicae]
MRVLPMDKRRYDALLLLLGSARLLGSPPGRWRRCLAAGTAELNDYLEMRARKRGDRKSLYVATRKWPEVAKVEKRTTGPHPHEQVVNGNNNNAVSSQESITVMKGRRGWRLIKATGITTYANILRRLYEEPAIQETVGKSVKSIRRSASGAMVLQLRKGVQNASALRTELDGVLGDATTASALSHKTTLEIRDLDEGVTKEEICTALCHQLGKVNMDPDVVRYLRKAYVGTQTAVIDLPDELVAKAIKLGHLRVSWVSCRVRERAEASRCFRCWEFNHVTACCVGSDRSKLCCRSSARSCGT